MFTVEDERGTAVRSTMVFPSRPIARATAVDLKTLSTGGFGC